MASSFGPLEFDHDEPTLLVDCQEIDPTTCVFPLSELLSDDKQVLVEDRNVVTQQSLEIVALPDAELGEACWLMPLESEPVSSNMGTTTASGPWSRKRTETQLSR